MQLPRAWRAYRWKNFVVHSRGGERYVLHASLQQRIGSRIFKDMKTHEETTYSTYREAHDRLGLYSDDVEWKIAICDSFAISLAPILPVLATVLAHCFPIHP